MLNVSKPAMSCIEYKCDYTVGLGASAGDA